MPQYDAHHETVKRALEKDGWKITHDPFIISVGGRRLLVDLAAEKMMELPREAQKVAIEIKGLGGASLVNDLHRAIGQYQNYRYLLRHLKSERKLYLAASMQKNLATRWYKQLLRISKFSCRSLILKKRRLCNGSIHQTNTLSAIAPTSR